MKKKEIYLAGGCFWGVEAFLKKVPGVLETQVGYANGKTAETSYYEIGRTGHSETVKVIFDEEIINLPRLLEYFFAVIDPTTKNRQGNDIGTQYRTGIYFTDPGEEAAIRRSIEGLQRSLDKPVAIEVGMQNGGMAASMAREHFPLMPLAAAASVFSGVMQNIVGGLVAAWWKRRPPSA